MPSKLILKTMAERAKPRSLKYAMHRHLSDMHPARDPKIVHASDLTKDGGICPRYYALLDVTGTEPNDVDVTASNQMTWEIGRRIQDTLVEWFADIGMAISDWQCRVCGAFYTFQHRPVTCQCGGHDFKPSEPHFVSRVSGASCGVDMLIDFGDGLYEPVELKTIDKDEFKTLVMPLAEHRLRTNLYCRMIDEADDRRSSKINTDGGWVFYTSKGGYGSRDTQLTEWGLPEYFSPFKEFWIDRDDRKTQNETKRATVVKDFRSGKKPMPEGVCLTAFDDRAKNCPCRKFCFSGDFPPEYMWNKK